MYHPFSLVDESYACVCVSGCYKARKRSTITKNNVRGIEKGSIIINTNFIKTYAVDTRCIISGLFSLII